MNSNTEEFNSRSEESTLSTGDETLCTYGSIFGVLISCTGLLQLFLYARFHWITMLLTGLYGFGIAAYVSLGLQKGASVYLVYANIIITLIIYIIYTRDGIWSLIVIVFCA
jgi:hypothetical protein